MHARSTLHGMSTTARSMDDARTEHVARRGARHPHYSPLFFLKPALQDFRKGKCTRGASCKYSHAEELCRDYNRGECRLAPEQCRYVHKLYSEVGQVDPFKQKRARSSSSSHSDEQNAGAASPNKVNTVTTISSDGVM